MTSRENDLYIARELKMCRTVIYIYIRSVLRMQSRDTDRNIKKVEFRFLSDERPMLETLDYSIPFGSTPTLLYFDLYHNSLVTY